MNELKPLRGKQPLAMELLRESLRSGRRRPVMAAPTGFGKTLLAAHIVTGALRKLKRVAFVVPMVSLIDQTFTRFVENGIAPADMGVMQGDHPWRRGAAPLQICSVQTLAARGFPEVDIVVCDEAHLRFAIIDEWMRKDPKRIFVGLTATPGSKGMADSWDDLLTPTTVSELIADGYLSPFKVFAPSHPDLSGVKIIAGDYAEGQLSERMCGASIVADVVSTWLEKGENRPTLLFAVDRAHAALCHQHFKNVGVACAYIDANTDRDERKRICDSFERGEVKIICSVGTMTTGVDLDVRCVIFARPTKSEILYTQCIGRGLRIADGKSDCIILDHSDTTIKLGMVTDISFDALKKGGRSDASEKVEKLKQSLPRECAKCTCLIPAGVFECPHCGFVPAIRSNVIVEDGELFELGSDKKAKSKKNREWTWEEKATFMGEMLTYVRERGFKEGYAAAKYRDRFGVWPNDPRVKNAPPEPISMQTRAWIQSQNIRFAKSKEAARRKEGNSLHV